MKISDYIATFLEKQGVQHVFEVVGGMITHLIDSMHNHGAPTLVSMHHEQGAAFAADAAGRISGVPGVAMATSGPGAINLLTGIGSAYFDSSPTLFITGQVNCNEQKGERNIRQLGFQEADIVSMSKPVTKCSWSVNNAENIPSLLSDAFTLARTGRPGPVLLDIAMDVQRSLIKAEPPVKLDIEPSPVIDSQAVERMLLQLKAAQRPLILAGGGIRSARAADLFRSFVRQLKVPVVHSLMAVDCLDSYDPMRVGLIGTYGNRWANMSIGMSDFILVIGSRLDIRQTGSDVEFFKGKRTIYQVDCEEGEVNNRVKGCHPIMAEIVPFLVTASAIASELKWDERHSWLEEIKRNRIAFPDISEIQELSGINPNEFMHYLGDCSSQSGAYVVDVGQHQMWAAQSLTIFEKQRFITSGGMGAMGFSLPAAIGATFALNRQPVVVVVGDGSLQLNIQELQTVVRNNLPIKLVVLNNHCHGMVRQFQESYFNKRYQSTMWGYSAPNFAKVANAFDIQSQTIEGTAEIRNGLKAMWSDPQAPYLLQVMIDSRANAYPKIAFGKPLTEMEPLAKPLTMNAK